MSQAECQAACKRIFAEHIDVSQKVTEHAMLKCLENAKLGAKNLLFSFLYYIAWNHPGLIEITKKAIHLFPIEFCGEKMVDQEREIMLAVFLP